MPRILILTIALCLCLSLNGTAQEDSAASRQAKPKPLRALLIAGGCCHDYAQQQEAISKGIQARANVRVDVYWTDNSTTTPVLPLYRKLNWAEEYDVIIHDECAADIKDIALVNRIVQVHQELPAVHLHCAMHSFRTGTEAWFKHLGLQSSGHGAQLPIDIKFVKDQHPITATLGDWTTIREELYNTVRLFGAKPLAMGMQRRGNGANERVDEAIVAWVNESAGARSFSTTIGHNTETVRDPRYLDLITRGLLWACDKLNDDYLRPYDGDQQVTFIDKREVASTNQQSIGKRPAGSTLVYAEASSTQQGHPAQHAIDGDRETRWCADGPQYPASLTLQFEQPVKVEAIRLLWESRRAYQYQVEGSTDGQTWQLLLDRSDAREVIAGEQALPTAATVSHLRITGKSGPRGGWCSIREVSLKGPGLDKLWPAGRDAQSGKLTEAAGNAYEKRGNVPPRIEPLSPEQEAKILREVRIPDGFVATVFAAPPAVNYPVFVAATVDGTLFVSSDGNGSLGRQEERGRVIRLRDLDGDGRADETKVFCEVDAPRGLVWDHDRLYLMHPPHLSVFIDRDGDGVADIQKTLVKNLAFGYDKRPADHTTNGLSLGVDGWLYIAGGDFGFMNAEGADGTTLTHRGGGVIRVRPDGSGLEIYSTGTRNILEVAISPQMEMFARDNTNDGGGWDVRLHHFTGNDNHGYPRIYKNFNDECMQPLADYGGGSGCGAVFIDEPGMGDWNNAPFTADWGTGSLYRHTVSPRGATYAETEPPQPFISLPRPTDADVDGNSRVYCASWLGATFNWAGPDVGYIVCVKPKDFTPAAMPDFAQATDDQLAQVFNDPSYRRRMETQRELMRRGSPLQQKLLDNGLAQRNAERQLLARLQDDTDPAATELCLNSLNHADPVIVHTAIRMLAKRQAVPECFAAFDAHAAPARPLMRALAQIHQAEVVNGLIARLSDTEGDNRQEVLAALCRLHYQEAAWKGDSWGTRPDTRGPYYEPVAWDETPRIAAALNAALDRSSPAEVSFLIDTMLANRIEQDDTLSRLVSMAAKDHSLVPDVIQQLSSAQELPAGAMDLLEQVVQDNVEDAINVNLVQLLSRLGSADAARLLVQVMGKLDQRSDQGTLRLASRWFINAKCLANQVTTLAELVNTNGPVSQWAGAGLLVVVAKNDVSPEAHSAAVTALNDAWQQSSRQTDLMLAATKVDSHFFDRQILAARENPDVDISQTAARAIELLQIEAALTDTSPLVKTLDKAAALEMLVTTRGNVQLGKQAFAKANCTQCHSLTKAEVQKGPFLGSIARTYKRPELALAVMEPSKTIAQGFATNIFETVDGKVITGFVTDEQSTQVTFRDNTGKETTLQKDQIEERRTSPISVMPEGVLNELTVNEAASLLDFIQSLAEQVE